MSLNGDRPTNGSLRATIDLACAEVSCGLGDMTVLAAQNDPFRVDSPARHRDGEWLAVQTQQLGLGSQVTHIRDLHYKLFSGEVTKPDGKPYTNTDSDWHWLVAHAAKAARWLGYIPFEQIKDARSPEPVIRHFERPAPWPYLHVGIDIDIPDPDELEPSIGIRGFDGVQPFKLVLFGEKSSLQRVLEPIAYSRGADLYLPAGEISDTFLHTMAKTGAEDGRPMVVFTISDCDPAGWQMPLSIARKLQAFKAAEFPDLRFQVRRVALQPDQVRTYGLPSTPLKETERRADRWQAAMGVEQTEVDALASLRPEVLDQLVRQAIKPFYDTSLDRRVLDARRAWETEAQARLDEQLDQDELNRIQREAAAKLAKLEAEIAAINEALNISVADIDLPEIVVPEPVLGEPPDGAVIDSQWDWSEQTRRLKAERDYRLARAA
jgi:hypothetical protein